MKALVMIFPILSFGVVYADQSQSGEYNAEYKVSGEFVDQLYAAAFNATGDSNFRKPAGGGNNTIVWDPRPSTALKALGLEFGADNKIAIVYAQSIFYAKGDAKWLARLEKIIRNCEIDFRRIR